MKFQLHFPLLTSCEFFSVANEFIEQVETESESDSLDESYVTADEGYEADIEIRGIRFILFVNTKIFIFEFLLEFIDSRSIKTPLDIIVRKIFAEKHLLHIKYL